MEIQNPHDKFFKETLGNVEIAKDFITNYLPEKVLRLIDVNTLEPQKDSFINKELQESYSDLLFKVMICNQEGYLYLLFEHKSYVDKGTPFQLLKYMVEIWESKQDKERAKELPIIIPLVIYHGQSKWNVPTSLTSLINGYDGLPEDVKTFVPSFEYLLYDISRYSDEDIKGSAQTRIMLTLFRDILTKTGEPLRQSIDHALYYLLELEDKETAVGYLETMMRYIFSAAKDLTQNDVDRMIMKLETSTIGGSEWVMTLADMW
uniref:Rpn family recombination-promoting nuclease/putative transposase n=1 Tax=Calidifontibacillus erzurumensis TaxID=2741433 RepID=UPI0035B504B5